MLTFEGDEKSELDTKRKGMRSRWSLRSNRFELRTLAGLDANDSGKSHRLSARLQFSAPDSGDPAWENSRQADCEYRQTHVYFLQLATDFWLSDGYLRRTRFVSMPVRNFGRIEQGSKQRALHRDQLQGP